MASAHHPAQASRYSLPSLPNGGSDFRLPSLKDLNFQYRPPGQGQEGPPLSTPGGSPQAEHVGSSQSQPGRHDPSAWGRPSPTTPVSASMPPQLPHQTHQHPQQHQHHQLPHPPQHQHQHQHSPQLSAGHQQQTSRPVDYGIPRHDNGGYLTPGLPLSAQVTPLPGSVTIGPGSRGDDAHPSKRSRTNSNMSIPRDNRSHASYPIPQSPQYSPQQQTAFHPVQPGPGPPPHEQVHQHTGPGAYPHPQYGYQPPQYMSARAHNVQPLHPHHQQPPQGNPYLPPQQDSWEHQQQPQPHPQAPQHHHQHAAPPQQQQQQQQQPPPPQHQHYQPQQPPQINFASARTTPLVPQTVDSRVTAYPTNHVESDQKMSEIIKHCTALYTFASRYAQLQASLPRVQPTAEELLEMNQRAAEVVRLLEEYRRLTHPEFERRSTEANDASRSVEGSRPPKRPWEDIAKDEAADEGSHGEHPVVSDKAQSTAEQDMEIIRTKRATSTAGGSTVGSQPKSKYRKRSSGQRATPPGKCHSCNIRETPEWRRGPDGARTLCNACGLHYAKLMRKRDKQIAAEGQAPRIDMETLRASARAADLDKLHSRSQVQASSSQAAQVQAPGASTPSIDPSNQSHHQGSFQVVNMGPGSSAGPNTSVPTPHAHQIVAPPNDGAVAPVPPPWAGPRVQSFMRTSQHSGSSDASPR